MKFLTRAAASALLTIGLVLATGTIAAAAAPFAGVEVVAGIDDATIVIPVAPLGVTAIVSVLATYAISALNGILPFVTQEWQRKVLSIVAALAIAALGLVGYYLLSGAPWPSDPGGWFGFGLIALGTSQTAYNLVTKQLGAKAIEQAAARLTS